MISRARGILLWASSWLLVAAPAQSFEAFDGRLQAHGFYEMQMRSISADYSEDWDLVQWYHIFNLEIELDLLQDTVGFIDTISGFVRLEARYDCVYTRGCGTARSVNMIGDRAKSLPRRLSNGRESTAAGSILISPNDGRLSGGSTDPVPLSRVNGFKTAAEQTGPDKVAGRTRLLAERPAQLGPQVPITETESDFDDPFPYTFERFEDYRFTQIAVSGGGNNGSPVQVLGPWLPKNKIISQAGFADRINPFDNTLRHPTVEAATFNAAFTDNLFIVDEDPSDPTPPVQTIGDIDRSRLAASRSRGSGALPYRPIPVELPGRFSQGDGVPRGVYLPSEPLQRLERQDKIDAFEAGLNFRESERAWNRGSSQQDEKELKEAYLDIDLFDSRLWIRMGKQQIVWGKTELFRTTDQFNPQDIALASLPSLEESRIALWSIRGIYSFYEVGPFADVRLELAMNFDQYESADFGACGEAYTVNLVCQGAFGALAHAWTGIGLAGARLPKSPWEDEEGIEFGGRLEWRWDRFSFAITEFYGYSDIPYVERLTTYERNVDPVTGRPRRMGSRNPCPTAITDTGDCLLPGPTRAKTLGPDAANFPNSVDDRVLNKTVPIDFAERRALAAAEIASDQLLQELADENVDGGRFDGLDPYDTVPEAAVAVDGNSLLSHHANLQVFTFICSTTIGVVSLDPTACAQNAPGSQKRAVDFGPGVISFTIGQATSSILAGTETGVNFLQSRLDVDDSLGDSNDPNPRLRPLRLRNVMIQLNADPGDLRNESSFRTVAIDQTTGLAPTAGSNPEDIEFVTSAQPCFDRGANASKPVAPGDPILDVGARCGGEAPGVPIGGLISANGESLAQRLTPEQEALLGCGPFWGTNCDDSGLDFLNADISVLLQSMVGIEGEGRFLNPDGSLDPSRLDERMPMVFAWEMSDPSYAQPGTENFVAGPTCGSNLLFPKGHPFRKRGDIKLPGCRGPTDPSFDPVSQADLAADFNYDPDVDGCVGPLSGAARARFDPTGLCDSSRDLFHPLVNFLTNGVSNQRFQNELAALSYNFMIVTVTQDKDEEFEIAQEIQRNLNATNVPGAPEAGLKQAIQEFGSVEAVNERVAQGPNAESFDANDPYRTDGCSLVKPQLCANIQGFFRLGGISRPDVRAGGSGRFGRRSFQWHNGGEVLIRFEKRNVLGFSSDFAVDSLKSNFSFEFTWIDDVPRGSFEQQDGLITTDQFNLTISADRPTFINFLNPNRTFFFNTQWFFQYIDDWQYGAGGNGPWNILMTFAVTTGYFQDRLLPSVAFVYDFKSVSGAALPQLTYRYNEDFSITVGANIFMGRAEKGPVSVNPIAQGNRISSQSNAFTNQQENGLAVFRDRDEVFVRLRYTF